MRLCSKLQILSIAFTRSHNASGLTWTQVVTFYPYWPEWTKSLSTVFQITPLFLVFFVGAIQLIIYLYPKQSSGLFHERIQVFNQFLYNSINSNRILSNFRPYSVLRLHHSLPTRVVVI